MNARRRQRSLSGSGAIQMGQLAFEGLSIPPEDVEDVIEVNFTLIGSQHWFDTAFEPGAVFDDERIVISDDAQLKDAQLKPIVAQARSMKVIGVDTETTGDYKVGDKGFTMNPNNKGTRIVLLQLGDEDQVWLIEPALIEHFREVLESDDQLKLAHNWEYDFKWLLVKNHIHPRRLYCTMLAEQLLTAGRLGYKVGLADCARRYKPHNLVSKAVRSKFADLGDGKMTREMVEYAVQDIPLLFPVYQGQFVQLGHHDLTRVAALEFDNIPVAAEMEATGFCFDREKLSLLIRYWNEREQSMKRKILEEYTERRSQLGLSPSIIPGWIHVFNLKSNKEKLEALKSIGVVEESCKDVKRATLKAADDPIAEMMAEYSNILKMTSTYGKNMLDKINPDTDRCYPRFAQMGFGSADGDGRDNKETIATGRWAGDAQQYPRKSDGQYADPFSEEERVAIMAKFADLIANLKAKQAQEEKAG